MKNLIFALALGLVAFSPILEADEKGKKPMMGQGKKTECALQERGEMSKGVECDDRFILKEKEFPDACDSMPIDKEECGRWYAASASRILIIRDINFESGKSELLASGKSLLGKYVVLMKENPKLRLRVIGHADAVGSEEVNQSLSLARARAVVKFFEKNGVPPGRLMLEGKGESEPIVSNKTEEGRWENRRVEMRFLKKPALYGQNLKVVYGR